MANVESNLFNMHLDFNSIDDIKNKDFINVSNKIIEPKPYKNLGKDFLNDVSKILHSCKEYKGVNFEEININYSNFQEYHYEIMNNRYLVVIYDKENNIFKYIAHSGKVFITSDIKVITIINNVPLPYKISINYVPLLDADKTKSLSLLSMVLFNITTQDSLSLITEYLKPTATIYSENEYYINYYLFTIYPRIEKEINNHNYWKYIHLEQEIYNISRKEKPLDFINYEYLNFEKELSFAELKKLSKETKIDLNSIYDNHKLLENIYENTEYYLTINKSLINLLGSDDLSKFVDNVNIVKFINYIDKHTSLPKTIISNSIGNISSSSDLDISFNFSSKTLIRGSYKDLYFKILAFIIHDKNFKNIVSSDKSLISELLKDKVKEPKVLEIKTYFIENYIKAKSLGAKTDDEVLIYFQNTLNTLLSEEDYNDTKDSYCSLETLKKHIDNYNTNNYKTSNPKLLYHDELEPIGIAIFDKIRLIQKSLIVEVEKYCQDFNKRNKSKMDIVYFDDEYLYLLVDEDSLNTAFDTLSRIMPIIFSKVCPTIVSSCYIEIIN